MLWMQGEADAGNLGDANAYATNLTDFIGSVRSDLTDLATNNSNVSLHQETLPFVIGQIDDSGLGNNQAAESIWIHEDTVKQKQAEVAAADSYASMIITDDLHGKTGLEIGTGGFVDSWHYNAASTVEIGSRFADEMTELVPEPSTGLMAMIASLFFFAIYLLRRPVSLMR